MKIKISQIKISQIKIRKTWGELNPVTRIVKNKMKYSRKDKYKRREW